LWPWLQLPPSWFPYLRLARSSDNVRDAMKIAVAPEPFDSADARRLIAALDEHLAGLYPPEQRFGPNLRPEQVAPGLGMFVLARADGVAIGCGALRILDGVSTEMKQTAELKRMYVEPPMRGRGVGKAIVEHLEAAALTLGARRMVLETGIHQTEAIGLYERVGFRPIECFGEYASSPTSVCYEKTI
jgi:putative acetyltransferase